MAAVVLLVPLVYFPWPYSAFNKRAAGELPQTAKASLGKLDPLKIFTMESSVTCDWKIPPGRQSRLVPP